MLCSEWTVAKFFWFFFVSFFSFLYFTYYGMMIVSVTPNQQVAAVFVGVFYGLFNLFSSFLIPRPRIPKWWIWYYWICPVAWKVYGLIVSQYGDVEDTIKVPGIVEDPTIKWYIENHYGYDPNFMSPIALGFLYLEPNRSIKLHAIFRLTSSLILFFRDTNSNWNIYSWYK